MGQRRTPWTAYRHGENRRVRCHVLDQNGEAVASCNQGFDDACLIAAAPDLLKAAKAAREVLTVMFNARKDGPGKQAYEKLGAAIAKASQTGE